MSRRSLPCALKIASAIPGDCTVFASEPSRVVRGSSVEELADAWNEAKAHWQLADRPRVPVGIGYLSYELGRRFERIRGAMPQPAIGPGPKSTFASTML